MPTSKNTVISLNPTNLMHSDFLLFILSYLLGSVPFGMILTRLAGIDDIRKHGSGNIGATNVLRIAGKKLAIATLLLDGGKGAVAVAIATLFASSENALLLCAFLSVIGHIFPVWLKFKGGKGVATTLAVLLATAWPVGVAVASVWAASFTLWRISSLAALIAAASAPLAALYFSTIHLISPHVILLTLALSLLVIIRHHQNITRLLQGNESPSRLKK
jgi:glycerol-3-phosphate acyltransferase PlsY